MYAPISRTDLDSSPAGVISSVWTKRDLCWRRNPSRRAPPMFRSPRARSLRRISPVRAPELLRARLSGCFRGGVLDGPALAELAAGKRRSDRRPPPSCIPAPPTASRAHPWLRARSGRVTSTLRYSKMKSSSSCGRSGMVGTFRQTSPGSSANEPTSLTITALPRPSARCRLPDVSPTVG